MNTTKLIIATLASALSFFLVGVVGFILSKTFLIILALPLFLWAAYGLTSYLEEDEATNTQITTGLVVALLLGAILLFGAGSILNTIYPPPPPFIL